MKVQVPENDYAKRRRDNKIRWCLILLVITVIAIAYLLYKPNNRKKAVQGSKRPVQKPQVQADELQGSQFMDADDGNYDYFKTTTFDTSNWYMFSTTFGNWQERMGRPLYKAWDDYMTTSPADFDYNDGDDDNDDSDDDKAGDDNKEVENKVTEGKDLTNDKIVQADEAKIDEIAEQDPKSPEKTESVLISKILPQNNASAKVTIADKDSKDIYRVVSDEDFMATDPMAVMKIEFFGNYKNPCFSDGSQGVYCFPAFFIAGMPRCGTRDLHQILAKHPYVIPSITRSPSFWTKTKEQKVSLKAYLAHFQQQAKALNALPEKKTSEQVSKYEAVTFDANPSLFWKGSIIGEKESFMTPANVKHILPNAKIILMVRDPVERLYSEYMKLMPYGVHEKFGDFVKKSIENLKNCEITVKKLYECIHKDLADDKKPHLETGMYVVFYEEWLKYFPKDQIMVVIMEDFIVHRVDWIKKICAFLGLPSLPDNLITGLTNTVNSTIGKEDLKPMDEETKSKLYDFYLPHNMKFAEKLQDSRLTYPDPSKRVTGKQDKKN